MNKVVWPIFKQFPDWDTPEELVQLVTTSSRAEEIARELNEREDSDHMCNVSAVDKRKLYVWPYYVGEPVAVVD